MKEILLPIGLLRFSKKKRRGVSPRRIEELRAKIEMGEDVMPILARALHDGTYVVSDGRHRIQAHLEAGITVILARVKDIITRLKLWLFAWSPSRRSRRFLISDLTKQILCANFLREFRKERTRRWTTVGGCFLSRKLCF